MAHLDIDLDKCIGCGKCTRVCMKGNIVVENKKAKETGKGCLECSHCVSTCPKGAITLIQSEESSGPFSNLKKEKIFDGGLITDADLDKLFYAMDHGKGRCEFFVLEGSKLDAFMETVWNIVKDSEREKPLIKEWSEWRDNHDLLQPNPVLWEGKQVLFIFADSDDRAVIASNRMIVKGLDLGIRGFHSNLIMLAYVMDKQRIRAHFPAATKELRMCYVIGHGRRMVEPILKPIMNLFSGH